MTNFSKRHYEAIADLLNGLYLDLKNDGETLKHVENELLVLFGSDNAQFKSSTFLKRAHVGLEKVTEQRAFLEAEKRFEQAGGQLDEHPFNDVQEADANEQYEAEREAALNDELEIEAGFVDRECNGESFYEAHSWRC